MKKHIPYHLLGHMDHGWLKACHHFSFGRYINRERRNFGALLVVNDDTIAPKSGFPMHPHDNMEIITYVRSGAITHDDNNGGHGVTRAGDVQVMSAGYGIEHSEYNREDEITTLYQIWIIPARGDVAPRFDSRQFPQNHVTDTLPVLVSGQEEHKDIYKNGDALYIHQDAALYGGRVKAGKKISVTIKHQAYVLASKGVFTCDDITLNAGDALEVTDEKTITFTAQEDCEIVVIDVPSAP